MRFLGLKASLMLEVELRSKKPSISWYIIRPRERLIIKLAKNRLRELSQEKIEWNFGLDIIGLSNYTKYPRNLSSLGIPYLHIPLVRFRFQ